MFRISHRDIKPGSFFFVEDELKLTNFNEALKIPIESDEIEEVFVGSEYFMSPEIYNNYILV